jgi:hypothetical protein
MYVRIARFEGIDVGRVDADVDEMRSQMRSGELPADAPPEAQTLMTTVRRFVQLVDRQNATTLGLAFCESEEDVRSADEALNAMSPPTDAMGRRTSVEIYEVALDESVG